MHPSVSNSPCPILEGRLVDCLLDDWEVLTEALQGEVW